MLELRRCENILPTQGKDRRLPTQMFRIERAPESNPISAEDIRKMLWSFRKDSEWGVMEWPIMDGSDCGCTDTRKCLYHIKESDV